MLVLLGWGVGAAAGLRWGVREVGVVDAGTWGGEW